MVEGPAPRPYDFRPGRTVLDPERYRDFEIIGAGGMGVVFLAFDNELNRPVAVKVVRPRGGGTDSDDEAPTPFEITPPSREGADARSYTTLCDRFLQEAWLTGALEHPGIVPVYELGTTARGVPYYTMRYVKGVRTLETALAEAETLTDRLELLEPFLSICDTLSYAHSRGVIHRDLKPANIGLGEFGEVVVLDWGLAKMQDEPETVEAVWQDRIREFRDVRDLRTLANALGTPGYMAPEAAFGDLDRVDERSDVYGLGAILYGILTGGLPFSFESYIELLNKLREHQPRPASAVDPAVPEGLSEICARALSTAREDRHAGAAELAAAIREEQKETGIRSEIRGLMQQAEDAFDAAAGSEGDARLRQLDSVRAYCLRVLAQREGHARAGRLLSESDRLRKQTEAEREAALRDEAEQGRLALVRLARRRHGRRLRRVAAVFLLVFAVGTAVAAVHFHRQRGEAQTREAAERGMLRQVGVVEVDLEKARAGVLAERDAGKQAHAELESLQAVIRAATGEAQAALAERDRHRVTFAAEHRQWAEELRAARADAEAQRANLAKGELAEELRRAEEETRREKEALVAAEEKRSAAAELRGVLATGVQQRELDFAKAKVEREAAFRRASEAEAESTPPLKALAHMGALHGDDVLMALARNKGNPRDRGALAMRVSAVRALGLRLAGQVGKRTEATLVKGLGEFADEPAILVEIVRALGEAHAGTAEIGKLLSDGPRDVEVAREAVRALGMAMSSAARDSLLDQLKKDPARKVNAAILPEVLDALREVTELPFRKRETWLRWAAHWSGKTTASGSRIRWTGSDNWRFRVRNPDDERWRHYPSTGWKALGWVPDWPWLSESNGFSLRRQDGSTLARQAPSFSLNPFGRISGDWAFVDVGGLSALDTFPLEEGEKPRARRNRCVVALAKLVREKLEARIPDPESSSFDRMLSFAGASALRHSIKGSPDGGSAVILQVTMVEHNELLYIVTVGYGPRASRQTIMQLQKILKSFEFLDD